MCKKNTHTRQKRKTFFFAAAIPINTVCQYWFFNQFSFFPTLAYFLCIRARVFVRFFFVRVPPSPARKKYFFCSHFSFGFFLCTRAPVSTVLLNMYIAPPTDAHTCTFVFLMWRAHTRKNLNVFFQPTVENLTHRMRVCFSIQEGYFFLHIRRVKNENPDPTQMCRSCEQKILYKIILAGGGAHKGEKIQVLMRRCALEFFFTFLANVCVCVAYHTFLSCEARNKKKTHF